MGTEQHSELVYYHCVIIIMPLLSHARSVHRYALIFVSLVILECKLLGRWAWVGVSGCQPGPG